MLKTALTRLSTVSRSIRKKMLSLRRRVEHFAANRPLISFVLLLAILLVIITITSIIRRPPSTTTEEMVPPLETAVFVVGAPPELTVQAQIEKTGVIKLVALSGGVVQKVSVTEGQRIQRGARIVSLSSNYQGGSVQSLSRQIAQKSYQNTVDTFQLQLDAIEGNRQLALKGETQSSTMRDLARMSYGETRDQIALNEQVFNSVDQQLTAAIASSAPQSTLDALRSQKAQILAGLSGLRTGLRNSEYLNSDASEPAQMAQVSRDNTLRQLELQRRGLELSRDIAELNLKIAQVSEALLYPVAPCAGEVERVFVSVGQVVAPGTPLAILKADSSTVSVVALVSSDVARQVSPLDAAKIHIKDHTFSVVPRSIADEPTDGMLHAVSFALPSEANELISQGASVMVSLALHATTQSLAVPLDSVYQSQDGAYVLITTDENGQTKAVSKRIELGTITGASVQVLSGLAKGDRVLLNRQVMADEVVEIK